MAEIVNLRRARKQRDRDLKEAKASENRIQFGRPKQQTTLDEARRAKADRLLDGHRRETGGETDA